MGSAPLKPTHTVSPITPPTARSEEERGAVRPDERRDPAATAFAAEPRLLALRRSGDVLVSATAMVLLTPLWLLVAGLIKLTSPGPILYCQTRVGQNRRWTDRRSFPTEAGPQDRRRNERRSSAAYGKPFTIFKFRTMVVNAEEYGPQWSSRNDPRITRTGRFLRLTRIDETPQFFNVLRGDMSLIGPRPERPYFVNQFAENIPGYAQRLRVPPGITGQAQISLDYDSSIDDVKKKLEQDLEYVEKRSFWQDLRILCRTVLVVVSGKGAC